MVFAHLIFYSYLRADISIRIRGWIIRIRVHETRIRAIISITALQHRLCANNQRTFFRVSFIRAAPYVKKQTREPTLALAEEAEPRVSEYTKPASEPLRAPPPRNTDRQALTNPGV